jgi:hypothetical protein
MQFTVTVLYTLRHCGVLQKLIPSHLRSHRQVTPFRSTPATKARPAVKSAVVSRAQNLGRHLPIPSRVTAPNYSHLSAVMCSLWGQNFIDVTLVSHVYDITRLSDNPLSGNPVYVYVAPSASCVAEAARGATAPLHLLLLLQGRSRTYCTGSSKTVSTRPSGKSGLKAGYCVGKWRREGDVLSASSKFRHKYLDKCVLRKKIVRTTQ